MAVEKVWRRPPVGCCVVGPTVTSQTAQHLSHLRSSRAVLEMQQCEAIQGLLLQLRLYSLRCVGVSGMNSSCHLNQWASLPT